MKRLLLTLGVIGAYVAVGYYVWTHPSRERVDELRAEYESLKQKNEEIEENNARLRRRIGALRDNPKLRKRVARTQAGLAHPDEVILQFEEGAGEEGAMRVTLKVGPNSIRVAGSEVQIDRLAERLNELHDGLPSAELDVSCGDGVGALRRERVLDIVRDSPFSVSTDDRAAP